MAGAFTIQTNPPFLNARTNIYTAWSLRDTLDDFTGPGVADYESFRVKQRGAGANLSADIGNTSLNRACIRGTTRDGMGFYFAENIDYTAPTTNTFLAQINTGLIFTTGDATNPRIDQVFLRILDQQHDGGASNLLQVQVVDGTATGGATLDNRTGVGAVPANSILLADVLMPALASTVTTANIRDRRQFPLNGTIPPNLNGTKDIVVPFPEPTLVPSQAAGLAFTTAFNNNQIAALVYIPRRIVGCTIIRWRYTQQGAALTGNYNFGIYDASCRLIASTGATAFAGAINTIQNVNVTLTPTTTFEPGWYYVLVGFASLATGSIITPAWTMQAATAAGSASYPLNAGIGLTAAAGGTTLVNSLLTGFTDVGGATSAVTLTGVPMIKLSVG